MPVVCPTGWDVEDRLPAGVKIAVEFPQLLEEQNSMQTFH